LTISVADVQTYRDVLAAVGAAPKTINHRVSALSSFCKYLALSAPSCACRSWSPTRHIRNSSRASRPIRAKKRFLCRQRAPGSC